MKSKEKLEFGVGKWLWLTWICPPVGVRPPPHWNFVMMPLVNRVDKTWVGFHQFQVAGYDAISWKIWPMGCQIALMSYLTCHWSDFSGYCIISRKLNLVKPDSVHKNKSTNISALRVFSHQFWVQMNLCKNWMPSAMMSYTTKPFWWNFRPRLTSILDIKFLGSCFIWCADSRNDVHFCWKIKKDTV